MNRQQTKNLFHDSIFIGPALLFFFVITVIPFLFGLYYSFTSWNGVSGSAAWVGLDNYVRLFSEDTRFLHSFGFTFRFMLVSLVLSNVIGFGFALALSRHLKLTNLLRVSFFIPNVLAGLLLGFIWQFILLKGFPSIGQMTGLSFFKMNWLGDASTGFWGMVIVFVWQVSGYLMVIYISALQNVDSSIVEAARIDGASGWRSLIHIIIPLIMPSITICLFLSLSMSFKVFDLNLSLTAGGPFNSTESVTLNIYKEAFQNNRYGLGSAKAILFFLVVSLITLLQVSLTKRREVQL
ncbi:carbohydrate ABC transporter permease [Paenibacillus hexagrammi]|uniref:Sugar ABC transporter permease n=1 Tax=Paenibacillus hexagrammi TaxID=2908839 RepID=A0ABY3SJV6_9BACL|nr:sugar ABC transporter permease [Paenibacillus sp. YPD9-1]UJF33994.1 sugar ABC transporter permease [Paenibacillus sp. YPD9-1]